MIKDPQKGRFKIPEDPVSEELLSITSSELLHTLFEKQVLQFPGHIALVAPNMALTYAELQRRSTQAARRLREAGARPNKLVAIVMQKGWEQVVGVLAVLQSGAAYLPIDPAFPTERIRYLLENGEVTLALTQSWVDQKLDWPQGIQRISLDQQVPDDSNQSALDPIQGPADLAYVIFTSGSTGIPKGVMVEHRSAVNTLLDINQRFALTPGDRVFAVSSLSFDLSVYDIFGTLAAGATVVLPAADGVRDPSHWAETVFREGVTIWDTVPALMGLYVEYLSRHPELRPRSLRYALLSGDWIPLNLPDQIHQSCPGIKVLSGGGATEAAVWSILFPIDKVDPAWKSIPYGRPMLNQTFRILDERMEPCPVLAPGQLHIGGIGVARGYWRDEKMTAASFIRHPETDERLYRTGDMGRYLPDGNIEFLGRWDSQVQISGFRVELGEIESVLSKHPAVRLAAVKAIGEQLENKRLVAYVVCEEGHQISKNALRSFLARKLPEYMVPSQVVFLQRMPLNPNGKVDRNVLPDPAARHPAGELGDMTPGTETERKLSELWKEILRTERAGLNDSFLDSGGDSLSAIRMVSRIQDLFGVKIPVSAILEEPTLRDIASKVDENRDGPYASPVPSIHPVLRGRRIPLSLDQEELWITATQHPELPIFNEPFSVWIRGEVDVVALQRSLNGLARRNEVLRTGFQWGKGEVSQLLQSDVDVQFSVHDVQDLPAASQEEAAVQIATSETKRPFDLAIPPLLRACIVITRGTRHLLSITVHHLVADAFGMYNVFFPELATLYDRFSGKAAAEFSPLRLQFADFVHWQRQALGFNTIQKDLEFWRQSLAALTPLELPTDHHRPATRTYVGKRMQFAVPQDVSDGLKAFSRQEGATLFHVLLGGFVTLLHRYSQQDDIVIGTYVDARDQKGVERMLGYFLRGLALRFTVDGRQTLRQTVQHVKEVTLGAIEHGNVPLIRLLEALRPRASAGRLPLFDVAFLLEPESPGVREDWEISQLVCDPGTSTFDLSINLEEQGGGLCGRLEYRTDLFDESTIARLIGHYKQILREMVRDSSQEVNRLMFMGREEWIRLLKNSSGPTTMASSGRLLHDAILARCKSEPGAVAVLAEDAELTYEQLDMLSATVATHLRRRGVGGGSLVGVCVGRKSSLVPVLLGVLRSGAGYVPVDPAYPAARRLFILNDSAVRILITERELQAEAVGGLDTLFVEDLCEHNPSSQPVESEAHATDVAYVIYTSGSTGQPKGVVIEHRNALALVEWALREYSQVELAGVLAATSVCFDLSIFELFVTLAAGGTVILVQNPMALASCKHRGKVTLINTVPSAIKGLLMTATLPPSVRIVNLAGEPLSRELVKQLYDLGHVQKVYDLYGPSETTTYSTFALRESDGPETIGRPIDNTQAYVFDRNMQPVPVGVPGELYIAGAGVARGYLNRPELTEERFLKNPFVEDPGARMFKTGDMVRLRDDGNLEFLGRLDQQVKIRGYRVELGEIEVRLSEHPRVASSVVVVRDDSEGMKQLVAYVVPKSPWIGAPNSDLRGWLVTRIPDYMVPNQFVMLQTLPLTPNGKVDRSALPGPAEALQSSMAVEAAPRDMLEQQLVRIWKKLLNVSAVGIRDNFFDLGGHSLLAVRLFERIEKLVGKSLPLVTLFQAPTIEQLASIMREDGWSPHWSSLVPIQPSGSRPPFYCVHGIGGNILEFEHFVRHMDPDQPLYGIQAQGLDGRMPSHNSVEEMATHYVKEIREFQPQGPYYLGGSSFGGMVAYEIARQLKAVGEEVALMVFFDTHAPGYPRYLPVMSSLSKRVNKLRYRIELHWSNIMASRGKERAEYIRLKTKEVKKRTKGIAMEKLRRLRGILEYMLLPQSIREVQKAGYRADSIYTPKPYDVKATLFRAMEQPRGIYPDRTNGWESLALGGVEVYDIPGHHGAIMFEPRVRVLAKTLTECLKKAQYSLAPKEATGSTSKNGVAQMTAAPSS